MRLFGVLALLIVASPASASVATELAAIDAQQTSCLAKTETNLGMQNCTGAAHGAADKILNRIYEAYAGHLKHPPASDDPANDKEILRRLVTSERAWIAYRDAACDLQSSTMLGGTGEALVYVDCLYVMTKQRVKDLDERVHAE